MNLPHKSLLFWATDKSAPDSGILLYGGRFDPLHKGHIAVVRWLLDHLAGEVWIVPTFKAAYREEDTHSSFAERQEQIKLTFANVPRLRTLDLDRKAGCQGRTGNLLHAIRESEDRPIAVVVGEDEWSDLDQWQNIDQWYAHCDWVVMRRPQVRAVDPRLWAPHIREERDTGILYGKEPWVLKANNQPIARSATEIRNQTT